jgi:hypothetical protein
MGLYATTPITNQECRKNQNTMTNDRNGRRHIKARQLLGRWVEEVDRDIM